MCGIRVDNFPIARQEEAQDLPLHYVVAVPENGAFVLFGSRATEAIWIHL